MTRQPQIFAHRGAFRVAPENTLPAFAAALEMQVDGIELDVQCSADGHLVVIHDFDLDKTTSGSGPVGDLGVTELARLDAGSHFDAAFSEICVPTLDQVFDLVGDRCRVNIEIKSRDFEGGPEVDLVATMIQARDLFDQVIVSSFNFVSLIKMRWLAPRVELGLLHGAALPPHLRNAWLSPVIAPEALHPHHSLVDAEYMAWARDAGCAVNTWTVNDVDEACRLADLGVDAIISDLPDQLIAALV